MLMKGTNLKHPPKIECTMEEWIESQGIDKEHLDSRTKQILKMANDKPVIFPDWKQIANLEETLDAANGNIIQEPQQRAIAWKRLKIPTYAVHDYLR